MLPKHILILSKRIYPAIIMDGLTEHDYENASSNSQYVLKRRLRSTLPQLHGILQQGAKESIKIGFETQNMTNGKLISRALEALLKVDSSRLERGTPVLISDPNIFKPEQLHSSRQGPRYVLRFALSLQFF